MTARALILDAIAVIVSLPLLVLCAGLVLP